MLVDGKNVQSTIGRELRLCCLTEIMYIESPSEEAVNEERVGGQWDTGLAASLTAIEEMTWDVSTAA